MDERRAQAKNVKRFTSDYFDGKQYTKAEISKYESIYGRNFVSPGGEHTFTEFLKWLELKHGMRALDIGCGLGVRAFQMAREYGAQVDGIDISRNMIEIARERCKGGNLANKIRLRQTEGPF